MASLFYLSLLVKNNQILKKNIENKQFYFSVDENNKFIIKYINDKFNEIKI